MFGSLPSNVLVRDDCERIFYAHNAATASFDEPHHVFSTLFRAGLLGVVDVDHVTGKRVQKLPAAGRAIFEPDGLSGLRRTTSSIRSSRR